MPPTRRATASAPPTRDNGRYHPLVPPECIPNLDLIQIEDDKPVDGIFTEKQSRLLTEPLYSCWKGGPENRPFVALADVGLFTNPNEPPLVPDVMLSLDVTQGNDFGERENQSYFAWLRGKVPDVAIEIVSNREGGEDTDKLLGYARIRVLYYVIHDPEDQLQGGVLRVYELDGGKYTLMPSAPVMWLEDVGLGLSLWQGMYERSEASWLRWCDSEGNLIPTGAERAEEANRLAREADRRAKEAREEIERLKSLLRHAGVEPPPEASSGSPKRKKKRKKK